MRRKIDPATLPEKVKFYTKLLVNLITNYNMFEKNLLSEKRNLKPLVKQKNRLEHSISEAKISVKFFVSVFLSKIKLEDYLSAVSEDYLSAVNKKLTNYTKEEIDRADKKSIYGKVLVSVNPKKMSEIIHTAYKNSLKVVTVEFPLNIEKKSPHHIVAQEKVFDFSGFKQLLEKQLKLNLSPLLNKHSVTYKNKIKALEKDINFASSKANLWEQAFKKNLEQQFVVQQKINDLNSEIKELSLVKEKK